jgi:hypothetical protein
MQVRVRAMPLPAHAAEPAHGAAAAALPHDLVARVCSFLPPGDAILTVPRVSKALAAAVAPRAAELRAEVEASVTKAWNDLRFAFRSFSIPLWALQEAWPELRDEQRKCAAARAAFHGDLATLRWALPQRDDDGALFCIAAAAGGQLEALQYTRALGCAWHSESPHWRWGRNACQAAARTGQLAVLQWLRAQEPPCPWEEGTCSAAAQSGFLAVLQWLRAQEPPCPWDERTCRAAASDGHLAVLQWARAQQPPCPWDEETCWGAAHIGHLAVLQWACAQQPPCPWNAWICADTAADQATAQWIRMQALGKTSR